MSKPTNEQLAEAARLGVEVDGRLSAESVERLIALHPYEAARQDAADEALIASQTPEEIEQMERQMKAAAEAPKSDTLLVYLDYDTWIDDVRIRANPDEPQELPRLRAKELLMIGKARRADPLPGE